MTRETKADRAVIRLAVEMAIKYEQTFLRDNDGDPLAREEIAASRRRLKDFQRVLAKGEAVGV
jgi:hypothetical protein